MLNRFAHKALKLPGHILFVLMLVFPMVLKLLYIKTFLFLLVFFIVIIGNLKDGRLSLHRSIMLWTIFLTAVSLIFSLIGLLKGAPGALKQAQVYAFWPIVYIILISGVTRLKDFVEFRNVLIFSTIFIGVYGCIFVLTELKLIPQLIDLNFFNEEKVGFGLHDGYIEISFMGLNSLPFLIPFTISALAIHNPKEQNIFPRKWLWIALILGLIVVIASGRRAILLVTALSPVLILIFSFIQHGKFSQINKKNILSLVVVTALFTLVLLFYLNIKYNINFSTLYGMVKEGFDFGSVTNKSASIRRDQFSALMSGWSESPLFGAGHGASPGYIRDHERPWSYELYYVALLYQVGIVGFFIYSAGIIWIFSKGLKILKRDFSYAQIMLPVLVGMSCYLIANATNPYLVRFDGIWVVFLPLAIINSWLLKNRNKNNIPNSLL